MSASSVKVERKRLALPTYEPGAPDKHPMFLERRVYQGSSGAIYPLPFCDRIAETATVRDWDAIIVENEYLQVMVLPEIGGRIHVGRDKTNGYDFFYRQEVIKPALVGLAGPWISGGVEFNWPQHHRPATFMPVDVEIVHDDDGSVTVWCSDHDPLTRMKGMHGICLHPGKSYIELKVRLFNRTELVQSFLWWANAAVRVHEAYQSFFPPDVGFVADHARRAISTFPLCQGRYYGVDYAARTKTGVAANEQPAKYASAWSDSEASPAANDLTFYANIPVPTSYMCTGTKDDFFGGYDHRARAGLVHIADHHIAPGKKQWTWGNHEFGYAWDRNLTDPDAAGEYAPYIELMAGVYSDNQPDFSFLMPGETKTWSQYWYPIREIGSAQQANRAAAVSLRLERKMAHIGVAATAAYPAAVIALDAGDATVAETVTDLSPDAPFVGAFVLPDGVDERQLFLRVKAANGETLISYRPPVREAAPPVPATEPPLPAAIASADELYLTGLHLAQYRHATRDPQPYWQEALRRDPGDARCNNAVGLWHLRRGEFGDAAASFERAISRLTARNANPFDGEPYYNLGVALRHLNRDDEAFDAFAKATWNQQWQAASRHALGELCCRRHEYPAALAQLDGALRGNADNLKTRALRILVLRKLNRDGEADAELATLRALDPLDWWARQIAGETVTCDTQTRIDIALDYARAGFWTEAIAVLEAATPEPQSGTAPLVAYYLAWLYDRAGKPTRADVWRKAASQASRDYCFPARLEEITVLQHALAQQSGDGRAAYYLGNLFYAKRRHAEAIALWRQSVHIDPNFPVAWRNLGIGEFNIRHDAEAAAAAYEAALNAAPDDARLLYERDQLWKRMGKPPAERLTALAKKRAAVQARDDLAVEFCTLLNLTGRHREALEILQTRRFQPWEGGEGLVLRQHVRTHLALGAAALDAGRVDQAREHFAATLQAPSNLGEAHHALANQSETHYWLGIAAAAAGDDQRAKGEWERAASFQGDFRDMSVCPFSDMTYFSAQAMLKFGDTAGAATLLTALERYADKLLATEAKIDYFATSLPAMLLFEDDLKQRQATDALFLKAQACTGQGKTAEARALLAKVLARDPSHQLARDFAHRIQPSAEGPNHHGFPNR